MLAQYLGRLLTPDAIINFIAWMTLAFLLRKKLRGLTGGSAIFNWLLISALCLILAFTLRIFSTYTFGPGYWLFSAMWDRAFDFTNPNWFLNFSLFLPAGFAFAFSSMGKLRALGLLALMSLSIECLQFWARSGVADPADLVANVIGAGFGLLAGVVSIELLRLTGVFNSRKRALEERG